MENQEIVLFNELLQLKFWDAVSDWKEIQMIKENHEYEQIMDSFYDEIESLCSPDMIDPITYKYMQCPSYLVCMHRFDLSTIGEIIQASGWSNHISCPLCRHEIEKPVEVYSSIAAVYEDKIIHLVKQEATSRRASVIKEDIEWDGIMFFERCERKRITSIDEQNKRKEQMVRRAQRFETLHRGG
jgi:hypothetical protein